MVPSSFFSFFLSFDIDFDDYDYYFFLRAIVFYMLYGKLPYPDAKAPEDIRRSNLVLPRSGISSEGK